MPRKIAAFFISLGAMLGFSVSNVPAIKDAIATSVEQSASSKFLSKAISYVGMKEGVPRQVEMNRVAAKCSLDGKCWLQDNAHWCGSFTGYIVSFFGHIPPQDYFRARSWQGWGVSVPLEQIEPGDIYLVKRDGGGHVGIVHHVEQNGTVWLVSGNISNEVVIHPETRQFLYAGRAPRP